jgi:hypothetical protein
VITFHRISHDTTRVMAQMDVDPEGLVEKAGDALGVVKRRVKGDLERFKELIESQGYASGAWRGEVERGERVDAGTGGGSSRSGEAVHKGAGTRRSAFESHK